MSNYQQPNLEVIRTALACAGADENTQIAGSLRISDALSGIGRKKTPIDSSKKWERMKKQLNDALDIYKTLTPLNQRWLNGEIEKPLLKAAGALEYVIGCYPGGHKERAHFGFAEVLRRFFESNNLQISMSEEGPFVSIFAHCIGMDNESAKVILNRLRSQ